MRVEIARRVREQSHRSSLRVPPQHFCISSDDQDRCPTQLSVLILLEVRSPGLPPSRGQNHALIALLFLSSAHHPPPTALNDGPKLFASAAWTLQPVLPVSAATQFRLLGVPVCARLAGTVQPAEVCKLTRSVPWLLTPSTRSISPSFGQVTSLVSQMAGQVPQPSGMC